MTLLLCILTGVVTFLAFRNPGLRDRLLFQPQPILARREWYRLFASALIHANWAHLGFNLFALYSFGEIVEARVGSMTLLGIYVGSVFGGSVLSLWVHRNHDYSALGASGGVCGVIFAAIFLVPGTSVGLLLLPVWIPGPVFALGYLGLTFIALRREEDNVGHDAHFGGALVGLAAALVLSPEDCMDSPVLFVASLLFALGGLVLLARDPSGSAPIAFLAGSSGHRPSIRYQRYDEAKARRRARAEIDRILDKISQSGIASLSRKERARLEAFSRHKDSG